MKRRLTIGALALVVAAGLADLLLPPDLGRLQAVSVVVEDRVGRLLRPFASPDGTWRMGAEPSQVSPLYLSMLREMEDRRFGWHPGVDPLAMIRASAQMVSHGRVVSGGSTLTMQLARLLTPKPRTIAAKLTEMARAVQLQMRLGRDGVLAGYLTLAPFGGALEGVRAASLAWFGREPDHLAPAQAALLVALPQSPERLRPDRNPVAAKAARDRVLDRAAKAGIIAADVAASAKQDPVPTAMLDMPMAAPHLSTRLAAQATGAVVRTTLDGTLQRTMETLVEAQSRFWPDNADMAVMVVANDGRRVLAHVGSAQWRRCQIDLTRAVRSPGSTLKPFIYALAFDDLSLHPATLVVDAPRRFGAWMPRNFDQDSHGEMPVREALQRSLNVPAVQALELVGPARLATLLRQSGAELAFPPLAEPSLPLALGGVGMKLADLVMLYAGLGEDGRVRKLAYQAGQPADPGTVLVGQAAARAVLRILEAAPAPPGMVSANVARRGRAIAFKTGTSYGFRDAWAIGVSKDYTVGVWVGRPDGVPRPGEYGLATAAPMLFQIFDQLPPETGSRPPSSQPDHALYHGVPPLALARLRPPDDDAGGRDTSERPRLLFPLDGAEVEPIGAGIALMAQGGTPPLRWLANGRPLSPGAEFWHPDGPGFSRLTVVDGQGRQASASIRVVTPP
ncbi:penicillin-binding protein 1C [Magnetospirillum sp. 64-120]|uniref:penicillin-binding protein 1C n=1 Tax=Magnetospirillum sp. 64-120 TaxID=1895778 RepID=UPI000929AF07|nr:penicillin-binding protein 1C [Magnetospirillum sp. 64-120]OJX70279.1 MAG: penicillin-binding protein 1C [Magnetospirillum sp. 64-120]